ncbi:MAG: type II secretion system protein M [Gammaproteobacteria bacterium]|nr:type II secretion system protein M [Gammaproteobacteria bacterium]
MNALTEQLAGLSTRERLIVVFGGAAAVLILLYALVWQPWQMELERLRAQVPEKQQTLAWMQAQAARIESMTERPDGAAPDSELPLLTLVERSANDAEMREAITRMSPGDEPSQVRVWIDNVAFDRWLLWVGELNRSGIAVAEANIDRSGENLVGIRTTLQR